MVITFVVTDDTSTWMQGSSSWAMPVKFEVS